MNQQNMKSWEDTERSVTLTNAEWSLLTCYLLLTTNYRKEEREAWERLSTETDEDGNPVFTNAASNAKFYADLEPKLEKIRRVIDRM